MSEPTTLTHHVLPKKILELLHLYENGHLNLEPGFQRDSVWNERDRAKLIESILRNYPIPAIFLHRRNENGKLIFDVIDGKQRLESVFRFAGLIRGARFAVKTLFSDSGAPQIINWSSLKRSGQQHIITGYELPVIEVDGDTAEIIELFVRINSTGKALTKQEQRHAKYYRTPLLKEAARLANKFEQYFRSANILTAGQIRRMQHVELVLEVMLSLQKGDVLNRKTALDHVMKQNSLDLRQVKKGSQLTVTTLNRVRKMFPQLKSTRFRQVTDFYTLAVLIGKYEQEGLVLADKRRNRIAWDMLREFGTRVDEVRTLQKQAKGARPEQEIYRNYLMTVSQMTDAVAQRRAREQLIDGILRTLFTRKDAQRGFSPEQRRIIWNSTNIRICAHNGCGKKLTWHDFTVDHIDPHSKGGRTAIENAALMCRAHNSSKGNRARKVRLAA